MGKIVLPPPTSNAKGPKGTAFQQFVNYWAAHGYKALKMNANSIYAAAKAEHIDPVLYAALVLNESGGNFNVSNSHAGAVGIAQLMPSTFIGPHAWNGGVLPWAPKHQITLKDLADPGINLRLGAAYFGYLQGKYPGSAYGHYNAGPNAPEAQAAAIQAQFTATWITKWNPKYVSQPGTTAPPAPAGQQVPGGTAPPKADVNTFKDPFVVGVRGDKKHVKLTTTFNPNKALQWDGAPLTRSQFLSIRDQLTSHYVSYTGLRPTLRQIDNYIRNGWNTYSLDVLLSKSPSFSKSPIYKQFVPEYKAALKNLLPEGEHIPAEMLRQGVINKWSADVLAQKVRKLPSYLKSQEFKGNVATMLNVYSSIMGNPATSSGEAMIQIRDAALAGWSTDQFAAFLRSHKNYAYSTEYQSKAMGFLDSLGLITGSRTVLQKVAPGPGGIQQDTQGKLPADKRIPGNPNANNQYPLDMGATLG